MQTEKILKENNMRKSLLLLIVLALFTISAHAGEPKWWLSRPYRLYQSNLRDIDVDFDIDEYIKGVKEYKATAVMFNVGGIVANYPTELKYHYRNPYLKNDLVKQLVDRLHAENIKALGRFDFSKLHESLAFEKKDWLYKGTKGDFVNYNGQVHTCINGDYQQEYIFKILDEVFGRYDLDGIYLNMVGYHTWDYSGNYHGICQCNNCKERFKKWSDGETLPVNEDDGDAVFRKYKQFKAETSGELFQRIRDHITGKGEHVAFMTWGEQGVDVIRYESSSAMHRQLEWNYSASDNVKRSLGSWKDKAASNVTIPFIGYGYRHSQVSAPLTQLRIVENFANGGWLDYVTIGTLSNQEDRIGLDVAKELFRFHAANEKYFTTIESPAKVCLVRGAFDEYQGMFNILAENQIVFDVVNSVALEQRRTRRALSEYELLILPNITDVSDEMCKRIDDFAANGGLVLATGKTSINDQNGNPQGKIRLKSAGVKQEYQLHKKQRGTYFKVKENARLGASFEDLDLIPLDSDYLELSPLGNTMGMLNFIPPAMFGPPEKCYYTEVTEKAGLVNSKFGAGSVVFVPWHVATQYKEQGTVAHARLVIAVIDELLGFRRDIKIDAGPMIEVTRHVDKDKKFEWVALINHTGQNQAAFHKPVTMHDIYIEIKPNIKVKKARLLRAGKSVKLKKLKDGRSSFKVSSLDRFEIIVLE
jgi:hypothetical protein